MAGTIKPISERELLEYQADVKGSIFRQIRQMLAFLREAGFSQKDLAIKIGMNEGQLSRRLRGDYDLRLETLSDLARGLDCRIEVNLEPISGFPLSVSQTKELADRREPIEATILSKQKSNQNRLIEAATEKKFYQAKKEVIPLAEQCIAATKRHARDRRLLMRKRNFGRGYTMGPSLSAPRTDRWFTAWKKNAGGYSGW